MIALTILGVAVAAITGMIFWKQLSVMSEQLREMKSGGVDTHELAIAAGKQADAASKQADRTKDLADRMKDQADRTKVIADQAIVQAQAASSAAKTASDQLVLGERPWVKIKHRIISPLTFDVGGRVSGNVAMITVEDSIENVGQSVALNVLSWEDVIPLDPDFTDKTARARQQQWCEDSRHRRPGMVTGYTLFPHDPMVQQSKMGPTMDTVTRSAASNRADLKGKVAFILVGCVVYRSSFEPQNSSAHETSFVYYLGVPQDVGFNPYIVPNGIADTLRLILMPIGFYAD